MEVVETTSFVEDARRIRYADLRQRVERVVKKLEAASSVTEVPNISRVHQQVGPASRIRIGDYRAEA